MNPDVIAETLGRTSGHLGDHLDGGGEFVRWRHRRVGERRLESENAHGMDPDGMAHESDDRHRRAVVEEELIYGQFIPIQGDLIITLHGQPRTRKQAETASPANYYKVIETPVEHRDRNGDLLMCKFEVTLDRSGQW